MDELTKLRQEHDQLKRQAAVLHNSFVTFLEEWLFFTKAQSETSEGLACRRKDIQKLLRSLVLNRIK